MTLLLLGPLLLLSGMAAPPPAPVRPSFVPLTKAAYLAAQKGGVSARPRVTFPLKKRGGRIVIPTARGRQVFADKFVDTDRADQQQFEYLGYLPQVGFHVVLGHLWERSQWYLLDKAGRQLELYDEPAYAPDLQSFVSTSQGLEYSVYPNTIRLFRREQHAWREVWHREPQAWEPAQVDWLSSNTLLLKQKHWTPDFSRTWYTYAKLTWP